MLDVNNVNFNTLPKSYRKVEEYLTSIEMFSVETAIEKNRKKEECYFQNKCVSSQKIRMKKEEGATVAASHLPFLSGPLRYFRLQAGPAAFFHGNLHLGGKAPLTTENVLPLTRNAGDSQIFQLIDSPIQMNITI
jgi:hypothetical protein